jgi:hypothetical protein
MIASNGFRRWRGHVWSGKFERETGLEILEDLLGYGDFISQSPERHTLQAVDLLEADDVLRGSAPVLVRVPVVDEALSCDHVRHEKQGAAAARPGSGIEVDETPEEEEGRIEDRLDESRPVKEVGDEEPKFSGSVRGAVCALQNMCDKVDGNSCQTFVAVVRVVLEAEHVGLDVLVARRMNTHLTARHVRSREVRGVRRR